MLTGSRVAALRALTAFRRSGTWPQDALDAAIRKEKLDERDAALSQRICRGVLRNISYLDWHIDRLIAPGSGKLEPQLRDILRLSAYQILFLDRVPRSAAVWQGVELTRETVGQRAAGLTNAVLRRLSEESERDTLPEIVCGTPEETLATRFSHPLWLVRQLMDRLGQDGCRACLEADNQEPPLTIQTNTLKTDSESLYRELEPLGAVRHPWQDGAFLLSGQGNPAALPAIRQGRCWIQDAAARAAVDVLEPAPGMTVLDLCAAPGGKTFAAAAAMRNQGDLRAFDVAEKKLRRMEDTAGNLGITCLRTAPMDASRLCPPLVRIADAVLADVPCSGMGTLRKNPDVRYKTQEEIAGLPEIQLSILRTVSKYVKPGGRLVYSTCTILRQENEAVVSHFLEEAPEFCLWPGRGEGMRTFWPHLDGSDGCFYACLRRADANG